MTCLCKICGTETLNTGTQLCDRDWEVDRRLEAFLSHSAGRARVVEILIEDLTQSAKIEGAMIIQRIDNAIEALRHYGTPTDRALAYQATARAYIHLENDVALCVALLEGLALKLEADVLRLKPVVN